MKEKMVAEISEVIHDNERTAYGWRAFVCRGKCAGGIADC